VQVADFTGILVRVPIYSAPTSQIYGGGLKKVAISFTRTEFVQMFHVEHSYQNIIFCSIIKVFWTFYREVYINKAAQKMGS